MVATERKLRAKSETNYRQQHEELREELREAQAQREALKSALRVLEGEMGILKSRAEAGREIEPSIGTTGAITGSIPQALDLDGGDIPVSSYSALPQTASTVSPYSRHSLSMSISKSRSSSRDGIKSVPSSRPGTPEDERERSAETPQEPLQAANAHPTEAEAPLASESTISSAIPPSSQGSQDAFAPGSSSEHAIETATTPPLLPPPSSHPTLAVAMSIPGAVAMRQPSESSGPLSHELDSSAFSAHPSSVSPQGEEEQDELAGEPTTMSSLGFGGSMPVVGMEMEERSPWAD